MTLKSKIAADYITAFKTKNLVHKNLLSVVKGEIQTVEKNIGVDNLSDPDVVKILTKFLKNVKENLNMVSARDERLSSLYSEQVLLESYLPKQMSDEEIKSKILELVNSGNSNLGLIMKEFANLPADKKLVSEIAKELVK